MNKKGYISIVAALLLVAGGALYWRSHGDSVKAVNNFEQCVTAGYEVKESHPTQCQTPDGKLFVQGMVETDKKADKKGDRGVACTMEAKQCPDGSYVGRIGPNCEFASCPSPTNNNSSTVQGSGTLEGKVSIGPLCPVEPCSRDIGDLYSSRHLALKSQGRTDISIPLKSDGSFSVQVPAGTYQVTLSDCTFMGCKYILPRTVKIEANKRTEVNLGIDTGIR